jgi:hypothetical protein
MDLAKLLAVLIVCAGVTYGVVQVASESAATAAANSPAAVDASTTQAEDPAGDLH